MFSQFEKGADMTENSNSTGNDIEQPEKILLVDDNPTNLQVLFQTLDGRGYNLLVAKNGEIALNIARKAMPNLILLDIMMPGIDGYEVCRQLKADPLTREIPVIFLSALVDTKDKVQGLDLGAVDYVTKPFQPDEVIARVNTHLTIYSLKREVQAQRDELEDELQSVAEEQRKLLPKQLPRIDGLKMSVFYETSRYAGGDYYDIIKLPDNQWGFIMADAAGHSTSAAVLVAMTCTLLRSYPEPPMNPAQVLRDINEHLCSLSDNSFLTALYMVYDAESHNLSIARAGHPPPVLFRPQDAKAIELECKGVWPLAIDPYANVPLTETTLQSGDRLMLYTDGITERFGPEGECYEVERLCEQFAKESGDDPQKIMTALINDVNEFAGELPSDDDQAVLIMVVE
jgi:sigma-B regulation protein RsbU (phosphoserine phosphatase)